VRSLLKFLAWTAGILATIVAILYFFVFDVWTVQKDDPQFSASLAPTLRPDDVLLVSRHGTPARGSLVRCLDPDAAGRYVVARVTGMPGEVVHIKQERVTLDNQTGSSSPGACETPKITLPHPQTQADVELDCARDGLTGVEHGVLTSRSSVQADVESKVDPGRVYLVSDNRHFHLDSRDFGAVDPANCKHIVFRLWSGEGYGDSAHRFTLIW
jgi:signal peptidase I